MKPVKNKFYSWKPNRASEYLSLQEAWLLSIGGSTTGKRFKIRETGRNTLGWRNSWPRQMDDTVGRVVRATGEPNMVMMVMLVYPAIMDFLILSGYWRW